MQQPQEKVYGHVLSSQTSLPWSKTTCLNASVIILSYGIFRSQGRQISELLFNDYNGFLCLAVSKSAPGARICPLCVGSIHPFSEPILIWTQQADLGALQTPASQWICLHVGLLVTATFKSLGCVTVWQIRKEILSRRPALIWGLSVQERSDSRAASNHQGAGWSAALIQEAACQEAWIWCMVPWWEGFWVLHFYNLL